MMPDGWRTAGKVSDQAKREAQQGMGGDATLQQAADMGFVCDEPALEDFVRNYVDRAQD